MWRRRPRRVRRASSSSDGFKISGDRSYSNACRVGLQATLPSKLSMLVWYSGSCSRSMPFCALRHAGVPCTLLLNALQCRFAVILYEAFIKQCSIPCCIAGHAASSCPVINCYMQPCRLPPCCEVGHDAKLLPFREASDAAVQHTLLNSGSCSRAMPFSCSR